MVSQYNVGNLGKPCLGIHRAVLVLRRAFVVLIGMVILSVPVLGIAYILPSLFHGLLLALHVVLSVLLAINISFNFIAAACRHPGAAWGFCWCHRAEREPEGS